MGQVKAARFGGHPSSIKRPADCSRRSRLSILLRLFLKKLESFLRVYAMVRAADTIARTRDSSTAI